MCFINRCPDIIFCIKISLISLDYLDNVCSKINILTYRFNYLIICISIYIFKFPGFFIFRINPSRLPAIGSNNFSRIKNSWSFYPTLSYRFNYICRCVVSIIANIFYSSEPTFQKQFSIVRPRKALNAELSLS